MKNFRTIADIRREYGELRLDENTMKACPIEQFTMWFEEILQCEVYDPTAMVLSTVDEQGLPDSRVVLLKGLENHAFVFYTNYQSAKAHQLDHNPFAALNFYWPHLARSVRIKGKVIKTSDEQSDIYFSSRPKSSQCSALASPQSQLIENRVYLEEKVQALLKKYEHKALPRPSYWGGYAVIPEDLEFWQGRDNRLHDRIHYYQEQGRWIRKRLAP